MNSLKCLSPRHLLSSRLGQAPGEIHHHANGRDCDGLCMPGCHNGTVNRARGGMQFHLKGRIMQVQATNTYHCTVCGNVVHVTDQAQHPECCGQAMFLAINQSKPPNLIQDVAQDNCVDELETGATSLTDFESTHSQA